MNLGLSCLRWLKWTCYSEECFLGAAGGSFGIFFLQSEEFGGCWDNNASQEKFILCKLTASVLSLATALEGDEKVLSLKCGCHRSSASFLGEVCNRSWRVSPAHEFVLYRGCALRGCKKCELKDFMGIKWSEKEEESCIVLEIMSVVAKRKSILGNVNLLGKKKTKLVIYM